MSESPASAASSDRPSLGLGPRQIKAVEALASRGDKETLEEVARRAGVARDTLYDWRKLPEFQVALRERVRAHLKDDLPAIYRALAKKARGGDVKAMELALKVSGELDEARRDDLFRGYVHLVGVTASPALQEIIGRLIQTGAFGSRVELPAGGNGGARGDLAIPAGPIASAPGGLAVALDENDPLGI